MTASAAGEGSVAERPARGSTGVLVSSGAVVTVCTMPVFLIGGLAVQLRQELGLGTTLLGLVAALFFGSAAVAARPFAAFTERVGPTVVMRISAAGSAVCLFGIAVVPSALWLVVVIVAAGVVNSMCQPACNELLMRWVPRQRQGMAFAVKQAAIPAATLSAGLAVPAIALTIGWRWVFVIGAGLALLTAGCVPRRPWSGSRKSTAGPARSGGPLLILLSLGTGFGAAAANAMGAFVTVGAVQVGYGEAHAGLMLALGSAVGLVSRLSAGVLADRLRPDLLRMVLGMALVGSVGFLLIALANPVLFIAGLVLGFGSGWAWQGVFNFAVAARFRDRVASATAVTQTGVFVGGAAGPLVFGLVAGQFGTQAGWLVCFTMMALAGLFLFLARRR